MALQPSTQSCRVIWVREGSLRTSSMLSDRGRATRPSTTSFQAENFSSTALA